MLTNLQLQRSDNAGVCREHFIRWLCLYSCSSSLALKVCTPVIELQSTEIRALLIEPIASFTSYITNTEKELFHKRHSNINNFAAETTPENQWLHWHFNGHSRVNPQDNNIVQQLEAANKKVFYVHVFAFYGLFF